MYSSCGSELDLRVGKLGWVNLLFPIDPAVPVPRKTEAGGGSHTQTDGWRRTERQTPARSVNLAGGLPSFPPSPLALCLTPSTSSSSSFGFWADLLSPITVSDPISSFEMDERSAFFVPIPTSQPHGRAVAPLCSLGDGKAVSPTTLPFLTLLHFPFRVGRLPAVTSSDIM